MIMQWGNVPILTIDDAFQYYKIYEVDMKSPTIFVMPLYITQTTQYSQYTWLIGCKGA